MNTVFQSQIRRQPRIMPATVPVPTVTEHALSFHFLDAIQHLHMHADLDRLWLLYYKENSHSNP